MVYINHGHFHENKYDEMKKKHHGSDIFILLKYYLFKIYNHIAHHLGREPRDSVTHN